MTGIFKNVEFNFSRKLRFAMVKTEKIKCVSINWDSLLIWRNSFYKTLRRKRRRQVGKHTGKLSRKSSKDKRSLSNLDKEGRHSQRKDLDAMDFQE